MRLAYHCILSTGHLPAAERDAFDLLIAAAPRRAGRLIIDHPVLTIEAHRYGFAVHLGLLEDHPERPEEVSPVLWEMQQRAASLGADWLWFDRDEPPRSDLPIFADLVQGQGYETPKVVLCEKCHGPDVLCDAALRWDDAAQDWTLVAILDPAWCDNCGDTHRLEIPRVDAQSRDESDHA